MEKKLFACLVILSSFGLLDYDADKNSFTEVTFSSINSSLILNYQIS